MRSQFCLKRFQFHSNRFVLNACSIPFVLVLILIFTPVEIQCNKSDMFLRDKIATAEVTIQSNELNFSKIEASPSENTTEFTTNPKDVATNSNGKVKPSTEPTTASDSDSVFSKYDGRSSFISSTSPSSSPVESLEEDTRSTVDTFVPEENAFRMASSSEESNSSFSSGEDTAQTKSAVPTLLFMSTLGTMSTSTRRSTLHYHHTPSSTIIIRKSTTIRPVLISTSKPPKVRPVTPIPSNLIVRKRKRRPKPGRTTTTTTTLSPEEYDYYDSGESGEDTKANNTNITNSTTPIPLSKLAIAMIASSSEFDNSTGEELFFPQTPVNLLNILQAYTKQLQMANDVHPQRKPVVKIPNTPFMLNLSQLNFAAKLGISFYYSLIAIIPLIYLAFGGIGRLGFLDNFIGRRNGKRRKRSTVTYNHFPRIANPHFQSNAMDRAELDNDEYAWIIARISQIILEISVFSDSEED